MSNEEIAARLAIQELMLAYTATIDAKDFPAYLACFKPDAEIIGFAPEPLHGHAALLAFVEAAMAAFGPTQHLIGPPAVKFHGNTAHARTSVQALHYLKAQPETTLTLWGTYETDFVHGAEGWKISRHHLITLGMRQQ